MPQIKISGAKGLIQETSAVAGANLVSQENVTVLSTSPGVHLIQEVISLPAGANALVAGKGSFVIPQGAVLLNASLVVLTPSGIAAAGNGINVACGAAGTAVGGAAVETVEFLGAGATGEIPDGDIAIGNTAVAGQTVQALSGPLALAAGAAAHIYVNEAGNNEVLTDDIRKVLLTVEYAGLAPTKI